jgi:hypothetical protein
VRRAKGEKKRRRELLEKRRGTNASLYLAEGVGVADEASLDAIPDTAGGEWDHGAAKLEGVIHRCIFYRLWL